MNRWDAVAGGYDLAMSVCGWRRVQRDFALGLHGSVLDVGCGTGYLAGVIGRRCTGVDASMAMLGRAPGPRVCAQARSLPFPDTAFDTVVSTAFLGVIPPAHRVDIIAEMARVCRHEIRLLEPLAPLSRVRRTLALAPRPLTVGELSEAGLQVVDIRPPVFAGLYTPVTATPR